MNDATQRNAPSTNRLVGTEAGKTIAAKYRDGFVARYLSGENILDIGYRGYFHNAEPIVAQAIGIDLEYPGYDGKTLPFEDQSQDAIFSSHCLEHIADYKGALREWFRVLRIGGFMIVSVPHQYLYEKRDALPSRWNQDHKRFYTPSSLMAEVESALAPNTYRLRHLADNDTGFPYASSPDAHSAGSYEIEMVLERIAKPSWSIIPNLQSIDIGPQVDSIQWIGFSACETGFRWTDGERAAMHVHLSAELAESIQSANAAISLTIDTLGRQRVRALLNTHPVYSKTLEGYGLPLDIPVYRLQPGLNTLEFELPDATSPANALDQRHLGIAVYNIRLVLAPPRSERPAKARDLWNAVRRLFGRT